MNTKNHKEDDKVLLSRLSGNDMEAFSEIYNRYGVLLYTFILRYLKDRQTTEDILQQVFVKLWEIRHAIVLHTALKSYLYTMARNMVLNYMRNSNRALRHNYQMAQIIPVSEEADFVHIADEEYIMESLNAAICHLPLRQRNVVLLRREGLSAEEIAEKMNISINTVNTHYRDGLKNLRRTLSYRILE